GLEAPRPPATTAATSIQCAADRIRTSSLPPGFGLRLLFGRESFPRATNWFAGRSPSARLHAVARAGGWNFAPEQFPQGRDIAAVVAGLVNRRFEDERAPGEQSMIQYPAERLEADLPFSNVLVAVHTRAKGRLRIVHVHDKNAINAHRPVNGLERGFEPCDGAQIPAGCKSVGGINANAERKVRASVEDALQLFEARAD